VGYLAVFLWGMLMVSNALAATIEPYPGSQLVGSTASDEVAIHRLITGEVKRVNGQVKPESSDFVQGTKATKTFEVLDVPHREAIGQFFREQLQANGQLLFECIGRSCGASSYWANSVFNQAILYGPTEDQHYLLGKLSGDRGDYVIIYMAQRATGKRYAHIETFSDVAGESLVDRRLIASSLRLQSRFVIDPDLNQQVMQALRDVLNDGDWESVALVAHDALEANETVAAGQARTKERANSVKSMLEEMGTDTGKLVAIGAGPISPIDRSNIKRLELVVLK
jgi:hypothetical protein